MDETERSDEPPNKRQRVLACKRCRARKQRCDSARPCSNCQRSGDECVPTEPAPRPHVESEYVRALEERIAELEAHDPRQSLDHLVCGNGNGHALGRRGTRATTNDHPLVTRLSSNHHHHHHHTTMGTHSARLDQQGRFRRQSDLTCSSVAVEHSTAAAAAAANSPINSSSAKRSHSHLSPAMAVSLADDSEEEVDHLIHGLITSPSTQIGDAQEPSPSLRVHSPMDRRYVHAASIPRDVEELLLSTYRDRAQAQYPFFYWPTFLNWVAEYKSASGEAEARSWQGFFVNIVYAAAVLLLASPRIDMNEGRNYYRNGIGLLPAVVRQHNPILTLQAYLLLSIHALHRSGTQRIMSLASTTTRYCAQNQFHLAETEPVPTDPATRIEIQVRRRCFWSAYALDRIVMSSFHIPPSIPDSMITAKLYANVDDEDLAVLAAQLPYEAEIPDATVPTSLSPSLHIIQCRRIQSEITAHTLRYDYETQLEDSLDWRIRILTELETFKARVHSFSDPSAKGHTSQRWLGMFYHYTLLMLYRPTKQGVLGPAGDWSVQASSQACLIFRKSQMDRQVAQAWLGLLVQFQSGCTLLYVFWATPPEYRTENYDSPDVSDALRACSNILAIMTDRWPKADCLRDVFELLAREIPLVDRPSRPPTRISDAAAAAIREKLPQVRALILNRPVMRMLEEMISQDFPRLHGKNPLPPPPPPPPPPRPPSAVGTLAPPPQQQQQQQQRDRPVPSPSRGLLATTPSPATMAFEMPFSSQMYPVYQEAVEVPGLSTDELLAFPGMFDLEWN
ncbi:hypothetical protein NLU13_9248 [Sarocladium strictum]|uniref:Zn(2)-C6 fungal-type domain-containing protein n=1 Tax=Sarocladium strictum TaxID=5046 RepID=A0AA39G9S6_SARSR|nr:hypothetical protein NLU13_9248 [Sarocladium strictum]